MPRRRNALKLALLTAALGLIVLCWAMLACAPATPDGQASEQAQPDATAEPAATPTPTIFWLDGPPSASELATMEAIPTATLYPPGYVPPTDLPTSTPEPPWPTLRAQLMAEEAALQTEEAATQEAIFGTSTPEVSTTEFLLESVANQIAIGKYDAIARVRVCSSRAVKVAKIGADPASGFDNASRHTVAVAATYRGALPAQFDILTYEIWNSEALDAGQEYILGVYKFLIPESEYSSREPWRSPYTPAALKAAGGVAYSYNVRITWIVDGQTARKVPTDYFFGMFPDYRTHFAVARGEGLSLPLPTLEAALRPKGSPPQAASSDAQCAP